MTTPQPPIPAGPPLPYGTQVRVSSDRISLTCLATCPHGNACALVAERAPDQTVSLYFHGTQLHGARLTPTQTDALRTWLATNQTPPRHDADTIPDPTS